MGLESAKFNPEGKDFSIFLQGDIMRDLGLVDHKSQMEWVLKNSAKFREIIEENPSLKEKYMTDPEGVREFIKTALEETPEEPVN